MVGAYVLYFDCILFPPLTSKTRADLYRSRSYLGACLTMLLPCLLAAYFAYVWVQNSHRGVITTYTTVDLTTLPPLQLSVTCARSDATGASNPWCDDVMISGFSYRQPFGVGGAAESECVHMVPTVDRSNEFAGGATNPLAPGNFGLDVTRTWVRAGHQLNGTGPVRMWSCNASDSDGVGIETAGIATRALGAVPVCPFVQGITNGLYATDAAVGGLGFLLQTPAWDGASVDPELSDGGRPGWSSGPCQDAFSFTLSASDAHDIPYALTVPSPRVLVDTITGAYDAFGRTPDVIPRFPLLELTLNVNKVYSVASNGDKSLVSATAAFAAKSTILHASDANPYLFDFYGDAVALSSCGTYTILHASAVEMLLAAVTNVSKSIVGVALRLSLTVAAVAVVDVLDGGGAAVLAAHTGADAPMSVALEAAVKASISPSLAAAYHTSILESHQYAGTAQWGRPPPSETDDALVATRLANTAWRIAATGCAVTCAMPLLPHELSLQLLPVSPAVVSPATPATASVMFLQRYRSSVECGPGNNEQTTTFDGATCSPLCANGSTAFQLTPSWAGIIEAEGVAMVPAFRRGSLLLQAVLMRSGTMVVTEFVSQAAPTTTVLGSVLAVSGTLFTLLFFCKYCLHMVNWQARRLADKRLATRRHITRKIMTSLDQPPRSGASNMRTGSSRRLRSVQRAAAQAPAVHFTYASPLGALQRAVLRAHADDTKQGSAGTQQQQQRAVFRGATPPPSAAVTRSATRVALNVTAQQQDEAAATPSVATHDAYEDHV